MATQAQRQQAETQKNQKLQLEGSLAVSLISLVNKMAKEGSASYQQDQQIPDLTTYQNQLSTKLNTSYLNTQQIFSSDQIASVGDQLGQSLTPDQITELSSILTGTASSKSISQAAILLKTMQGQMNSQFTAAQLGDSSIKKVAQDATRGWKNETVARVNPTIVNTQVQSTAEDTKNQTTNYMTSVISGNVAIIISHKLWVTVGDDRVRPAHAVADGQIVPTTLKYKVGGELLSYPGDPTGSPENIINCRCSSLTIIKT